MKTMKAAAMTVLAAGVLWASPAFADSNSLLTLGVGSTVGLSHVVPVTGGSMNTVISEMNVRLRLLKVLGLDFNYNVTGERAVGHGEVYSSAMRASALLYLVPTSVLSVYLSAGAGASGMEDLTSSSLGDKSYHGGAGMEVYVGRHLALSTEFLMLVPQVDRVVISTEPLRVDGSGSIDLDSVKSPSVQDYVSPDNFQFTFGLKYYF